MNFIEAALSLLQNTRRSLTTEQLVERAEKENLLSRPGKSPQRSMATALSRELKKGDDSRVAQVGDDRWKLAAGADESTTKAKKTTKKTAGKKATTKKTTAKKATTEKTTAKKATTKKTAGKKATTEKATTEKAAGKKASTRKTTKKTAGKKTAGKKAAAESKATAEKKTGKKTTEKKTGKKTTGKKTGKKAGKNKSAAAAETVAPVEETPVVEAIEVLEAQIGEAVEADNAAEVEVAGAGAETAAAETERPARKGRRRKSRRSRRGGGQRAAAPEIAPVAEEASVEVADVLAPKEQPLRATPADTPAEEDIETIYGDELSGVEPGAAFAEYRDDQTEDEDRPMTPEIVASRRERPKRERRRRRRDRTERGRGEARADRERSERAAAPQPEEAPAMPAEVAPAEAVMDAADVAVAPAWIRPGNALGQAAAEVLRASNSSQPVRARQIAQMMHKEGLLGGDPDQLWPHVKAALISDEKAHLARGMRPPVEYRGRDLFALGPEPVIPELAYADESVASAIEAVATLTHAALKARLSTLDLSALERVAHVYLVRQGWQNIEWIKRVQRSSYAVAQAPDGLGTVLVGVRAGEQPVDRRGVGELRVGIQAKKLPAGLLLAPQGLSDIARQELSKSGPSISVLVGDAFVSALIHSGVGVRAGHVPVAFLDDVFFREVAFD